MPCHKYQPCRTDSNSDGDFHEIPATHHWLVKLMPSDPDLRDIVFRHDLFKKEMLVHQVVITQLHNFVEKKRGNYFWSFAKYILTLLLCDCRVNRVQISSQ